MNYLQIKMCKGHTPLKMMLLITISIYAHKLKQYNM